MNFKRIASVAQKEKFHILRDPFTLALALGLPMILVTVFGLAIEFNMREIRISAYDGDQTPNSRMLLKTFHSSNYFVIQQKPSLREALSGLETETAKASLIIEKGFERRLLSQRTGEAQILLDGADNSTVGIILNYIGGIQKLVTSRVFPQAALAPVQLQTRFLYNPELNSQWFVVPGLIVVIISLLSVLLTALTVAREWENGSMELLLSTPVSPLEIVIGKLFPYVVLALCGAAFVYAVARLGFHVPFRGSHLLLLLGIFLFVTAYLAQGLFISVITRKQQLATQIALIAGLLPSILLSGFVFSVEHMPKFFHYLTAILPARWFMLIIRSLFLKGASLAELSGPFIALLIINLVLVAAATKKFKKDVEP